MSRCLVPPGPPLVVYSMDETVTEEDSGLVGVSLTSIAHGFVGWIEQTVCLPEHRPILSDVGPNRLYQDEIRFALLRH